MSIAETPNSRATAADDVSVLTWLQSTATQNQPLGDVAPTIIPVARMGRTSTDDQQDPTLSLPRQLNPFHRNPGDRRQNP